MCPAITDDPMAPGRGLPVYQPATDVVDGTCSAPAAVTPRSTRLVCTPIAGMVSATGSGTASSLPDCATAAIGPTGMGSAVAFFHWAATGGRVNASPAAPPAAATAPIATTHAAIPF